MTDTCEIIIPMVQKEATYSIRQFALSEGGVDPGFPVEGGNNPPGGGANPPGGDASL